MAGSIGLKAGVHKAKPIILEPIMKMEVVSPKEFMGDVIGDISSRRAHIELMKTAAIWLLSQRLSPYPNHSDIPLHCGLRPGSSKPVIRV